MMPVCVVLYRIHDQIYIPTRLGKIVVVPGQLKTLIQQVESEWAKRKPADVLLDYTILSPSIISLVGSRPEQELLRLGILSDPYSLVEIKVLARKFVCVHCTGPQAQHYWEKGRKPSLPKELTL